MSTVIDLSQEMITGMQVFALHSPTHVLPWANRGAYGFQSEAIFCNSHAGTHVDAPFHFLKDGQPIDELPLDRFFGTAVVYDLSHLAPRSHISAAELRQCAEQGAPPQAGDIVLLRTGIDVKLGRPEYLTEYAGLSEEGATYLADRGVKGVGTDAAGIDAPDAVTCPAHHVLLPRGIVVFENLANLERLLQVAAGQRFRFYALPLKIRGASGSPVRAMAVLD
jgi:kynurenine formamidase